MKAFGYVSAKDVAHAVALLGEHGAKAKILAGGTDLLVELKHAVHNPEIIVDVSRLAELKEIVIAKQNLSKPAAFEKFGLRKGQALALVNVGAAFFIDKGNFLSPRIALGAVAPTVIRAPKAEAYLEGRKISAEAMAEAGRIAATEAKPISDFRASADYRRDLVAVLVKRALASAQARAAAKQKELAA